MYDIFMKDRVTQWLIQDFWGGGSNQAMKGVLNFNYFSEISP